MKLSYFPCNIPVVAVKIVLKEETFPFLPTLSYLSIYVMPVNHTSLLHKLDL